MNLESQGSNSAVAAVVNNHSLNTTSSNLLSSGSNNVHVIIRVRPHTDSYQASGANQTFMNNNNNSISMMQQQMNTSIVSNANNFKRRCIADIKENKQLVIPATNNGVESFTFDYVGSEEVSQEEIFHVVGKPIVDQCLQGYNGSIFAYGQTGSGKTYTIQGKGIDCTDPNERSQRGLLPRCFEYLFQQITKIKNYHSQNSARGGKRSARLSGIQVLPKFEDNVQSIEVDVRCQYLEIYNEIIIDLLDNSQQKVLIRETTDKGVYPDPCTEEKVTSISEVMEVINKGARNRHIASTNMNNESSRSHGIFTAIITMTQNLEDGEKIIKTSRFHIVDLAGSERCKDTGAEGQRLKEASMINKSLTTLGTVIYDLAENCDYQGLTKGKGKHIRYRESKLTYLLKDALGGNSKTVMICNVNPHIEALKETRSTLQFAQRAKMIKNTAVVNEENTSAKFWKDKYQGLLLLRQQSLPSEGGNANISGILSHAGQPLCQKCSQAISTVDTSKNQNQKPSSLKLQDTSKKYQQQSQQQLYPLLAQAQEQIKQLTMQLKEETQKQQEQDLSLSNALQELYKFRNSNNFQYKLKESQLQKAHETIKKMETQMGYSENEHIQQKNSLFDIISEENQELRKQVYSNQLLAAKHAQVSSLERTIAQLQSQLNSGSNNNGSQHQLSLNQLMTQVLDHVDNSIQVLNSINASIQSEQEKQSHYSKKHVGFVATNDDSCDRMDIDMDNAVPTGGRSSRYYHNQSSQMIQNSNDYSIITQKRDQEIANIKIQYEDQLETLKQLLKKEQSKREKLMNMLSQKSNLNTQQMQPQHSQQNLFGNNDFDLLSSQFCVGNTIFNTNNVLMNTQQLLLSSQQTLSTDQQQPRNLLQGSDGVDSRQLHSSSSQNCELQQTIDELMQLIDDAKSQINDKDQQLQILQEEVQQMKTQLDDLYNKSEFAMRDKIELETQRMQLEDQIKLLQAQIQDLTQDNEQLYQQLETLEKTQEDNDSLKVKVRQLEDENYNLQATNEYFSNNTIPELRKQSQMIEDQVSQMTQEIQDLRNQNSQLQELKSKDQEVSQLQAQLQQALNQNNEKEHVMRQIDLDLKRTFEEIDRMNNHIKYQQDLIDTDYKPQIAKMKDSINELHSELEQKNAQIAEVEDLLKGSEQTLIENDRQITMQRREIDRLKQKVIDEVTRFEDELRVVRTDKVMAENQNRMLSEQVEHLRRDHSNIQQQLSEERLKSQKYKDMLETHMEQSQKAIDTIQKYRTTNMDKSQQFEEQLKKLKDENKELREAIRDRNAQLLTHENKIKNLEQMRDKLVKDDVSSKLRNLERENVSLKNQADYFQNHAVSMESQLQMLQNNYKDLQKRYDELDKQYLQLLNGGDSQKFQHFNQIKSQTNNHAKQLMQVQNELILKKKEVEKISAKISELQNVILEFGDKVCQEMNINKNTIRNNSMISNPGASKPEINFKDYLKHLYEIFNQACTNQRLQLETPNNMIPSQYSLAPSSSENSSSDASSSEHRYDIFQYSNIEHFRPPPQQRQQQQPKPQNATNNHHQQQQHTASSGNLPHVNLNLSAMQSTLNNNGNNNKFQNENFNSANHQQQQQLQNLFGQQKASGSGAINLSFTTSTTGNNNTTTQIPANKISFALGSTTNKQLAAASNGGGIGSKSNVNRLGSTFQFAQPMNQKQQVTSQAQQQHNSTRQGGNGQQASLGQAGNNKQRDPSNNRMEIDNY